MLYGAIVAEAARVTGVPVHWINAVIGTESGDVRTFRFRELTEPTWEPNANEFAYGPMQILESTARGLGYSGPAIELIQPAVSIPFGARYLAQLIGRYGGTDFRRIYSAYNSGRPDLWETSSQVRANVERALKWLHHFQPRPLWGMVAAVVVLGVGLAWLKERG